MKNSLVLFSNTVRRIVQRESHINTSYSNEGKERKWYKIAFKSLKLESDRHGNPIITVRLIKKRNGCDSETIILEQSVEKGFQIYVVNELIKKLCTELPIKFVDYESYGILINRVEKIIVKRSYWVEYETFE